MTTREERLADIAARSEARSLTMLEKLRQGVADFIDLDELLDLEKPRLADATEGEEEPEEKTR